MEPRTIRNFRLLEEIGGGGMGTVFRAVQTTLDRPVAVKTLHPHLAKDADFLLRFEREAKTAATLQHENIVSVIDFGREGELYFLALEFVDGPDLRALLDKQGGGEGDRRTVLPVALTIVLDVLEGLSSAHARGIIHRDVKPANVMMGKDGIAKIADFSIATATALPSMTATGAMLGTPAYMSPEQAGGAKNLDERTDIFSSAVLLYEMLSGKRPFDGDTYPAVIGQVLTHSPPDLSEIDPLVPASIARVVKRALEKDPARRYAKAADFSRDLTQASADEKILTGRALVADFVKDPAGFQSSLRRQQARDFFQRGLYLMGQGKSHLNEAMSCLTSAASLDPSNEEAKKHLQELKRLHAITLAQTRVGPPDGAELDALLNRRTEDRQADIPTGEDPPTPMPPAQVLGPGTGTEHGMLPQTRRLLVVGVWGVVLLALVGVIGLATRSFGGSEASRRLDLIYKQDGAEKAVAWLDKQLDEKPYLARSIEHRRAALLAEAHIREYMRKNGSGSWTMGEAAAQVRKYPDDPEVPYVIAKIFDESLISGTTIWHYRQSLDRGGKHLDDPQIKGNALEVLGEYPPGDFYSDEADALLAKYYPKDRDAFAEKAIGGGGGGLLNAARILEAKGDPRAAEPFILALRAVAAGQAIEANGRTLAEEKDPERKKRAASALKAVLDDGDLDDAKEAEVKAVMQRLEGAPPAGTPTPAE